MADATQAPIGSGMAKLSMSAIKAKKLYDAHVMDAQSNGENPLSFEEWTAQQATAAKETNDAAQAKADQASGYSAANK